MSDGGRLERISRKLSLVLRHREEVAVRPDGFCDVETLLRVRPFSEWRTTLKDLQQIVAGIWESGNRKQRFQLQQEDGVWLIRATQGFSRGDVVADCAYQRLLASDRDIPDPCIHGTFVEHWQSILQAGLVPGGLTADGRQMRQRCEVHFAHEDPTLSNERAISGIRNNSNLLIWLDLRRALQEGVPFFWSENGVILSPGRGGNIPARYFKKVMDYSTEPPKLLWENGRPADLSELDAAEEEAAAARPAAQRPSGEAAVPERPRPKAAPSAEATQRPSARRKAQAEVPERPRPKVPPPWRRASGTQPFNAFGGLERTAAEEDEAEEREAGEAEEWAEVPDEAEEAEEEEQEDSSKWDFMSNVSFFLIVYLALRLLFHLSRRALVFWGMLSVA